MKHLFLLSAIAIAVTGFVLYLASQQTDYKIMTYTVGWMLTLLIGVSGLTILWQIWIGKIDMSRLFSEGAEGHASFSRFQFFIFTFVIAMCLFLVVIGHDKEPRFPKEIPASVLMLLGISSGSYLVAKGIAEKDAPTNTGGAATDNTPTNTAGPGGGSTPAVVNPAAAQATAKAVLKAKLAAIPVLVDGEPPDTTRRRDALQQALAIIRG